MRMYLRSTDFLSLSLTHTRVLHPCQLVRPLLTRVAWRGVSVHRACLCGLHLLSTHHTHRYCENSKKHCGLNLWDLRTNALAEATGTAAGQPQSKTPRGGACMSAAGGEARSTPEPKLRDQTMCAFKDSTVKQVTRGLSGPVDTWYPPAVCGAPAKKMTPPPHRPMHHPV